MNIKNMRIPVAILILGIIGMLALSSMKGEPQKKPFVNKPVLVETITTKAVEIQYKVKTQGILTPRTETTIVAEVSGVIKKVSDKFVVGGYFQKGDILLTINPVDYEIAVQQAKARLAGEKARLEQEKARVKQAAKEWSLTGRAKKDAPALALRLPNLAEAQANVDAAQAELKKAVLKRQRTEVKAPYDGMLKSKTADIGQFVNVGGQIGTLFAVDYAEVRLPLTEKDLAYLDLPRVGSTLKQKTQVNLSVTSANKRYQWQGFISHMEGVIDTKARVYYAVAQIDDPYGLKHVTNRSPLEIGSFVKAEILGKKSTAVIEVPRSAIRGNDQLLVMNSAKKLEIRKVVIQRVEGEKVFISEGVKAGEKVIITALETSVAGMLLKDRNSEKELKGKETINGKKNGV